MREEEKKWQEKWTADLINNSLQEEFLFGNVPPQLGGSLGQMAPGLLVSSSPAQGSGSLGLWHRIKFLRISIPDSFSGLGPGADAKNKLGSILDCFMVGRPWPLTPGPQLPFLQGPVSPTGQLWPGPGGHEFGG